MNTSVRMEKLLEELKSNIEQVGRPPEENSTEGFTKLCEYVTEWMIRKYNLADADAINWGYCFVWAYLVWALWPHGGVTFKTSTGHVAVKWDDHFYDSEHCDGRPDLEGFCCLGYGDEKHVGVEQMVWFWGRAGKQLRELRRLVRKTYPNLYKSMRDNASDNWYDALENFSSYRAIQNLKEVA